MHLARFAQGVFAAVLLLAVLAVECDFYAALGGASPLQLDGAALARVLQSAVGSAVGP